MAYEIIKKGNTDVYYVSGIAPLGVPLGFGLRYDSETGNYELKQKGLGGSYDVGIGLAILYQNGSWRSDALQDPKLFVDGKETELAKELNKSMRSAVYSAYQGKGGSAKGIVVNDTARPEHQNDEAGVNNSFPGTSSGISSAISSAFSSILPDELKSILEPGYSILANIDFKSQNETSLFSNKELLKYPKDILENQQDTLQITMYNYKAPLGETFLKAKDITDIAQKGLQRNSAISKESIGTVILPIPSGIQDNNAISWGDDNMNNLTAAATAAMSQKPGLNIGIQAGTNVASMIAGLKGYGFSPSVVNTFALLAQIPGIGGSPLLKPAVVSMLLKNAGFEVSPETILSRGFGIVPNSNLELLFNGPTLRQFQFNWRMSPRNSDEAKNVKRIIRFFKQGSAPRKTTSSSGAGASSLLLGTPNVFKLSYKKGTEEISGLNKFKICALTGMSVSYAPDGQWAAYDDSQPVSLTMSLTFQEIEPIYESDYQNNLSSDFKDTSDYSKVNDDDIGY